MPFGLHWIWAVALVVIILIVFGVGRLPSIGGALGRGVKDFKRSVGGDEPAQPDASTDTTKH